MLSSLLGLSHQILALQTLFEILDVQAISLSLHPTFHYFLKWNIFDAFVLRPSCYLRDHLFNALPIRASGFYPIDLRR